MKSSSIRGLFASVASALLLAGTLLSASAIEANARPDMPSAPAAAAKITSSFGMHQALPIAEARKIMDREGWKMQMYGYALLNDDTTKGIMTLFKQENSEKWRILLWDDKTATLAYEGDKLTRSEPLDPTRRLADIGGSAMPVNHPTAGNQGCGPNLIKAEAPVLGNIVAEGALGDGKFKMTIVANYVGEEKKNPVTWAMYISPAVNPPAECRVEAGYGVVFTPHFKPLPPWYKIPQP